MKKDGLIRHVCPNNCGHWEIIKKQLATENNPEREYFFVFPQYKTILFPVREYHI